MLVYRLAGKRKSETIGTKHIKRVEDRNLQLQSIRKKIESFEGESYFPEESEVIPIRTKDAIRC